MKATVIFNDGKAEITLTREQIAEINRQQDAYIQACIKIGETPRPELTDTSNTRLIYEDAFHRLEVCIDAKNAIKQDDGTWKLWEADYSGNESHFLPRHIKTASGWAYYSYVYWDTLTCVGPRREYRSYELMMEGVEEFDQYYQVVLCGGYTK